MFCEFLTTFVKYMPKKLAVDGPIVTINREACPNV